MSTQSRDARSEKIRTQVRTLLSDCADYSEISTETGWDFTPRAESLCERLNSYTDTLEGRVGNRDEFNMGVTTSSLLGASDVLRQAAQQFASDHPGSVAMSVVALSNSILQTAGAMRERVAEVQPGELPILLPEAAEYELMRQLLIGINEPGSYGELDGARRRAAKTRRALAGEVDAERIEDLSNSVRHLADLATRFTGRGGYDPAGSTRDLANSVKNQAEALLPLTWLLSRISRRSS